MEEITPDRLEFLNLDIFQPAKGYRFSIDAVILSDFAAKDFPGGSVLDVGAGCGVISLCLCRMSSKIERVIAVEIQERLYRLAKRNVRENGLDDKIEVVRADVRRFAEETSERFDAVVSNPPFIPEGGGRESPDDERRVARHEIELDSASLAKCVRRLLRESGRYYVIYPAWRLADVICDFSLEGLAVDVIRPVHPYTDHPASLVLLKGKKGGQGEVTLLPPLVIYSSSGEYSTEIRKIYRGKIHK